MGKGGKKETKEEKQGRHEDEKEQEGEGEGRLREIGMCTRGNRELDLGWMVWFFGVGS